MDRDSLVSNRIWSGSESDSSGNDWLFDGSTAWLGSYADQFNRYSNVVGGSICSYLHPTM